MNTRSRYFTKNSLICKGSTFYMDWDSRITQVSSLFGVSTLKLSDISKKGTHIFLDISTSDPLNALEVSRIAFLLRSMVMNMKACDLLSLTNRNFILRISQFR